MTDANPCYNIIGGILKSLLSKLGEFLGYQIRQNIIRESWKILNDYVDDTYGGWRKMVRTGIERGIDAAIKALTAVKEEIVKVCTKNQVLMKHLSKIAVKSAARWAAEFGTKSAVRVAAKKGTKMVAAQGVKGLAKAAIHPVGIAADIAQAGLEATGHENAGKTVGVGGNITAGALMGFAVGGPAGAAIGSLGGFLIWGVGEVTGGLIDRALSQTEPLPTKKENLNMDKKMKHRVYIDCILLEYRIVTIQECRGIIKLMDFV